MFTKLIRVMEYMHAAPKVPIHFFSIIIIKNDSSQKYVKHFIGLLFVLCCKSTKVFIGKQLVTRRVVLVRTATEYKLFVIGLIGVHSTMHLVHPMKPVTTTTYYITHECKH